MSAIGGVIIAAPASGSGKTVFTLGLLRHLVRSGVKVASTKAGPDYIDPAFHAAATGRPCLNLDIWAMRRATLAAAVGASSLDADLVVCEGVMGLFDGATATAGSTADLALATGWPVVMVIDVRAQGASAAAVLGGFARHRTGVEVVGVVFNRVGSPRHAEQIRDACRDALPHIPILGFLPRAGDLTLPERHLGLVQAGEHAGLSAFLDKAAALIAEHVDWRAIAQIAKPAKITGSSPRPLKPLGQKIAVARDMAFAFAYPLTLEGWRAAGAEPTFFSPLADEAPSSSADAVYLPGGYPELHAGKLAGNENFLGALRAAADRGAAIVGECGGYMVLGKGLVDANGKRHAMAGLLPVETSFAKPKLHLGYRAATLVAGGPIGEAGDGFRGHEFHYAETVSEGPGTALFRCRDATGKDIGTTGLVAGNVAGSFVHLIDRADA